MEELPGECSCVGGVSDFGHAVHFYQSKDVDKFSFHVGGGSADEVNKRSRDGLNQGERLQIIRDFCRDPDVKYLRISWFGDILFFWHWPDDYQKCYDACRELWVELMKGLKGRSILKCLVFANFAYRDEAVVDTLKENSSLIHFKVMISDYPEDSWTFASIVEVVSNSKSLELLHVCASLDTFGLEGWKVLMASLIPQDSFIKVSGDNRLRNESLSNLQPTTSLRELRMTHSIPWHLEPGSHEIVQEAVDMFVSMLVANSVGGLREAAISSDKE